jgi:hypothetical protein
MVDHGFIHPVAAGIRTHSSGPTRKRRRNSSAPAPWASLFRWSRRFGKSLPQRLGAADGDTWLSRATLRAASPFGPARGGHRRNRLWLEPQLPGATRITTSVDDRLTHRPSSRPLAFWATRQAGTAGYTVGHGRLCSPLPMRKSPRGENVRALLVRARTEPPSAELFGEPLGKRRPKPSRGTKAQGSIGQRFGGNAGTLQRTRLRSKALRSTDRRTRTGSGAAMLEDCEGRRGRTARGQRSR